MPTLIFINKIDRAGARDDALLADITRLLTPQIIAIGTAPAAVDSYRGQVTALRVIGTDAHLLTAGAIGRPARRAGQPSRPGPTDPHAGDRRRGEQRAALRRGAEGGDRGDVGGRVRHRGGVRAEPDHAPGTRRSRTLCTGRSNRASTAGR